MAIRYKCGELQVSDVSKSVSLVGRIYQSFMLRDICSNSPFLTLIIRDSSGSCRIVIRNQDLIRKVMALPLRSLVSINGCVELRTEPHNFHRTGGIEVCASRVSNIK